MAELKTVRLQLPVRTEDLRGLEIGAVVYLTAGGIRQQLHLGDRQPVPLG